MFCVFDFTSLHKIKYNVKKQNDKIKLTILEMLISHKLLVGLCPGRPLIPKEYGGVDMIYWDGGRNMRDGCGQVLRTESPQLGRPIFS